ncbi:MAG: formimidoylglutamase [Bacteroidota bacterium]
MDLSVFFAPIEEANSQLREHLSASSWGRNIQVYDPEFPDWRYSDLILIGCLEARGSQYPELAEAAGVIRNRLYQLSVADEAMKVADLGNLKAKDSPEAYYEMMAYVLDQLFREGKTVILLGGSQDLTYGQYLAYEKLGEAIEYVQIDSRFDLESAALSVHHRSYNDQIFEQQNGWLHAYTNLGYQSYFVDQEDLHRLGEVHFQALRYGDLFNKIEESEPALRTADMLSFDFSSVRFTDAPGSSFPSPGGFSAFEACRMARYAGLGYRIRSFSLSEYNPQQDPQQQGALLLAMMVWYFTEGYYSHRDDMPLADRSNLRKYAVQLHASVPSIDFYQHPSSGRWWMEVPYPDALENPASHNVLVPCSVKDYEFARTDNIPERWWKVFYKL